MPVELCRFPITSQWESFHRDHDISLARVSLSQSNPAVRPYCVSFS